jgi:hypothetical protein
MPQSASGKTIMTTEPKFVPDESVRVVIDDGIEFRVKMVDCVGYLVDGALGAEENGERRMVITPWSDDAIPFTEAAELGTLRVIRDHSTVGMLVTTDGTVGELPRSAYIPAEERVITIEDSAELQLQGLPNLVRLETRNSNVEGCLEITVRELIRASLRMRPTRIIVGEVRGEEAVDMLQCMNTGHDGSMSTGHANSAADMLSRLENMVLMGMEIPLLAIRQQIASGIDVIVHLGRLRDKSRRVLEVTEIVGVEDGRFLLNPLYVFEETQRGGDAVIGHLVKKGELRCEGKLKLAGLLETGEKDRKAERSASS